MAYRKPYYNEDHKLVRYGLKDFFSDAGTFFSRFFSPRTVGAAFANVIKSFREYLVFFLALIIVQSFFWILWMDFDLYSSEAETISRNCDYNLIVEGYTDQEWSNLFNGNFYIHNNEQPESRGYESYEISHYYGNPGEVLVRVKFLLIKDTVEYCNSFLSRYRLGGENVSCTYGERTLYHQRIAEKESETVRNTVLCALFSALIIVSLFVIRVNHFKFKYGIYMSFGANFEKLIEVCAWEMLSLALISFIPALAFSGLLFYIVTGRIELAGIPGRVLPSILWLLCVIFAAVIPAVRIIASKTPLSLISAEDNSNLVSSPMRSFRIFGKSFPFHYELYGFIRFRKYYAILLGFCIAFTTMYSCGIFLADMDKTKSETPTAQFNIESSIDEIDDTVIEEIIDKDGVRGLYWENTLSCTAISSHILLNEDQARGISGKTVDWKKYKADNNFRYFVLDNLLYEEVERGKLWETDGDLESVLGSTEKVAVTCSMNNQNLLNFKVGDTVTIAALIDMDNSVKLETADRRLILTQLLRGGDFNYYTVEIAAVIDDGDATGEYSVIMSPELYSKITGRESKRMNVSVYLEDDCSILRSEELRNVISNAVSSNSGTVLRETGAIYEKHLQNVCVAGRLITIEAFALLLVSPLVWFFSQSMFMKKRRDEIYILGALGGTDRDLSRLFSLSGAILACVSCVATACLSSLLTYGVFWFFNVFMPSFGFGENVRYEYSFSWGGFAVCFAVSLLSAVLASYLPFLSYIREREYRKRVVNGEIKD